MKNRIFFFGIFYFLMVVTKLFLFSKYNSTVACATGVIKVLRVAGLEARAPSARYAVGRNYVTFAFLNSIFKRTEEGFT